MSQIASAPSLAPTPAPSQPAPAAPATPAAPPTAPLAPSTPAAPAQTATTPVASNATPSATTATEADPTTISLSPTQPAGDEINIRDVFIKAGLDPKVIAGEYAATGAVSEETIKLILAADPRLKVLGKDNVRDHIEGQAARHALRVQRVETATKAATEVAGGAAQLETLKAWFGQNQPARVKSFEAMLKNDPTVYPDIVRIMANEYKAKAGAAATNPIIGGQTTNAAIQMPTTAAELAALNNRALAGDQAAVDVVMRMTDQDRARIKT